MVIPTRSPARTRAWAHPACLWGAFALVHILVAALALVAPGARLGDVTTVYRPWADSALGGVVMGISLPWVYPALAIIPIVLPALVAGGHYVVGWLVLVTAVDAAGFAVLIAPGRGPARPAPRIRAAWWWLAFTVLLGPVALSRLDTISVPLVIIAFVVLMRHPRAAAVLVAVATWIKVWPAAVVLAMLIACRRRQTILVAGVAVSALVVALAVAAGAGLNVLGFASAQADRGLQIEAPVSGIWMWQALAGAHGAAVFYDPALNTFEVTGPGIDTAIALMTPLMAVVAAGIALVGIRAVRGGARTRDLLPALSLALVAALIATNKVGSPQYLLWLAAPVVAGLAWGSRGFRVPAALAAVAAGLTQVFYPVLYTRLLTLDPLLLGVLTLRNLVLVAVLAWAVAAVWRSVDSVPARSPIPEE